MTTPRPIRDRLYEKGVRDETTGCLRFTGVKIGKGYGRIWCNDRKKQILAHIAAWELENGPVPEGSQLDHVYARGCRYKDCFEISHLEAVTPSVNMKRATETPEYRQRVADQRAEQTSCKRGHEWTQENTYIRSSGHRMCRRCHADREHAQWLRGNRGRK